MTSNPTVSVLMPAYNAALHIREAIESILNQSYHNFEFIIIDDGSIDNTKAIILAFRDPRIRYFRNKTNRGIAETLNRGIRIARGKYLARMDSDDIAVKSRLALQVEFLENNPSVAVVGSAIEEFFRHKNSNIVSPPVQPQEIRTRLIFDCVLMHPTVLLRLETVRKNGYYYSANHRHVEDFGLWQKISVRHDLANLPQVLLRYRVSENSITQQAERNIIERDLAHMKLYRQSLQRLKLKPDKESLVALRNLLTRRQGTSIDQLYQVHALLLDLRDKLDPRKYSITTFDEMTAIRFLSMAGLAIQERNKKLFNTAVALSKSFKKYSILSIRGLTQRMNFDVTFGLISLLYHLRRKLLKRR